MNAHASFWPIAGLMFLTGVGIPILATWNSALGHQLASPAAATFVLFAVGLVLSAAIVAVAGLPARSAFTFERPYIYFAAAFMVFYALCVTWAAPRIGLGNAVFFVLVGQMVAAAAIDHFSLWGAAPAPLTGRRIIGLATMALGVWLARKPL